MQPKNLDEIQSLYDVLKSRCNAIEDRLFEEAIAALRSIEPALPNNRQALHLAHNWLVCKGNTDARDIINRLHDEQNRLYHIQQNYWHYLWHQVYPKVYESKYNTKLCQENASIAVVYVLVEKVTPNPEIELGNHCFVVPEGLYQPTHLQELGYVCASACTIETGQTNALFGKLIEAIVKSLEPQPKPPLRQEVAAFSGVYVQAEPADRLPDL